MSLGKDEASTRHVEEKLSGLNHPSSEADCSTGVQGEDGDSRDSGIVSDYLSPTKVVDAPHKNIVTKELTVQTNTIHHSKENFPRTTKASIDESPITSRRPLQRILSYSLLPSDDEVKGSMVSLRSLGTSGITRIRAASLVSTSSFSCSEADVAWTPPKIKVDNPRSTSEERTATTGNFRKRFTENVISDGGIAKKRSCGIRTDFFQSEINLAQDEVFDPDDRSPNASYLREIGISSSTSRCFTRTQSTGQLEMGEFQQKSPKFGQEVEYSLPGVERPQHESLAFRSISAATLASEIRRLGPEEFSRRYMLVDCRYPYEYDGGHVKCAVNIHDHGDLEEIFFPEDPNHPIRSKIPIFYCEYSQKRGPRMALALRSIDRMRNELNYPKVDYAEMYLLDHGYRKFWNDGCYKSECDPCGYVPMTDAAHVSSLIKYKWHKSKSASQLVIRENERQPLRKASIFHHRSLMQVCTEVETNSDIMISPIAKAPDLLPRRLKFFESPDCKEAE